MVYAANVRPFVGLEVWGMLPVKSEEQGSGSGSAARYMCAGKRTERLSSSEFNCFPSKG